MAVEETVKLKIKCDNPNCPGNTLDPEDRTGWLFVSHEVYGQPTKQNVFCSALCVSEVAADVDTDGISPDPRPVDPVEEAPVEEAAPA